jgi:putative membrane protein
MKHFIITVAAASLVAFSGHAAAQAPSDAQIASIVVTANQVDIDVGKLAESKGSNAEVKAFGKQMVTDHSGVNKQAVALVTKLKVTPEDNATSKSLKAGGAQNVRNLEKLSGAAFDKAYVDHEVVYHQQVLDAVDKTLIPSAQNAELKSLLVAVRPAFVAHLEHAKMLQARSPRRAEADAPRCTRDRLALAASALLGGACARRRLGVAAADRARDPRGRDPGLLTSRDADGAAGRRRRLDQQGPVPAHGHGRRRFDSGSIAGGQVVALHGQKPAPIRTCARSTRR